MIRLIVSCIWICLVTAASGYAAAKWNLSYTPAPSTAAPAEKIQYQKVRPINVPMIANGMVQGYVVAQLGFTYNQNAPRDTVPPDVYLQDEAFRIIYSDPKLDFHHLEKYDIAALTTTLVEKVNERLKAKVVKDVLVQELNFVPKSDISK